MVIWRGFGLIVPILWILPIGVLVALRDGDHPLAVFLSGLAFIAVGVVLVFVGVRLSRRGLWEHTLFFLPIQLWGGLSVVLGLVSVVARFVPAVWRALIA